jgi:hypothetical protein
MVGIVKVLIKVMKYVFIVGLCYYTFSMLISKKLEGKELAGVEKVCKDLYLEKFYLHQGGVFGGEILEVHITDSFKYRKYLGRVDEKEYYEVICNFDSIKVYKMSARQRNKGVVSNDIFIKPK